MKGKIPLLAFIILMSCKPKPTDKQAVHNIPLKVLQADHKDTRTVKSGTKDTTTDLNEQLDAFADYYIIVADTGSDYYTLRNKMINLEHSTGIPIDTLGRYYNKSKDLIMLPDTADDDIYAGDYYPRRYPSQNLSLEYMDFYKPGSKKKTLGLIAGIYETKISADSALKSVSSSKEAFAFKAKVYVGCMH